MQSIGHIIVSGEKILVLSRFVVKRESRKIQTGYRALKIRNGSKDGQYFQEESEWLEDFLERVEDLKAGKVIHC